MGLGEQRDDGSGMSDIPETGEKKGINRRSLIKRAAATGAVAWTAPVILDSMMSPAAAASCGNIYRIEIGMNSSCNPADMSGIEYQTPGTYVGDKACSTSDFAPIPPGYSTTPQNVSGTSFQTCVTMSGDCSATSTSNSTATLSACTPSGVTCNAPRQFLGAGIYSDLGSLDMVDQGEVCEKVAAGGGSTTHIASFTTASSTITFTQPGSNKADKSGAWQFVIGCSCT